jgi:hypothetical protein
LVREVALIDGRKDSEVPATLLSHITYATSCSDSLEDPNNSYLGWKASFAQETSTVVTDPAQSDVSPLNNTGLIQ